MPQVSFGQGDQALGHRPGSVPSSSGVIPPRQGPAAEPLSRSEPQTRTDVLAKWRGAVARRVAVLVYRGVNNGTRFRVLKKPRIVHEARAGWLGAVPCDSGKAPGPRGSHKDAALAGYSRKSTL